MRRLTFSLLVDVFTSVVIAVDLPDVQLFPPGELDVHKIFRDIYDNMLI
jgi:hypothetical protein